MAKLSTGAFLRRPKAIVVDTEGTQSIRDKHGFGSFDLTSCLEVDQLLERTPVELQTVWADVFGRGQLQVGGAQRASSFLAVAACEFLWFE